MERDQWQCQFGLHSRLYMKVIKLILVTIICNKQKTSSRKRGSFALVILGKCLASNAPPFFAFSSVLVQYFFQSHLSMAYHSSKRLLKKNSLLEGYFIFFNDKNTKFSLFVLCSHERDNISPAKSDRKKSTALSNHVANKHCLAWYYMR